MCCAENARDTSDQADEAMKSIRARTLDSEVLVAGIAANLDLHLLFVVLVANQFASPAHGAHGYEGGW